MERPIVPAMRAVTAGHGPVYAGGVEPLSLSEITQRVSEFKLEHRALDAEIDRLVADIQADELSIKRLKKRKLWLKDCISRLESALIPDEPA
jgi:hypothetical protein